MWRRHGHGRYDGDDDDDDDDDCDDDDRRDGRQRRELHDRRRRRGRHHRGRHHRDVDHGAGGSIPCAPAPVDLDQITVYDNPPDLASWPITTLLTEVDFTNDGVHVEFDKEDGPNRWPDVIAPGFTGPLEYTLGIVECVDGQWATSAVIEFWNGLYAEGGNVAMDDDQIAINWYYDGRWGTLAGRQPAKGETIGVFVAAGNLRNVTTDDPNESPVMERSNVVFMAMPDVNGSMNSF